MYDPFLPNPVLQFGALDWQPQAQKPPRTSTVLMVEDDLQAQVHLDKVLKSIDGALQVDRVATAEEARDLIDHTPYGHYDLVIADQFLKGSETGIDLWNHCRKNHPLLQFMLVSGTEIDTYLGKFGVGLRCPLFMKKPYKVKVAREMIGELLSAANSQISVQQILFPRESEPQLSLADTSLFPISENWQAHHTWASGLGVYVLALVTYSFMTWSDYRISFQEVMKGYSASDSIPKTDLRNTIPQEPIPLKKLEIWDYPLHPSVTGRISSEGV